MKTIYCDIETVPADTATLEAQMPDEIRSPVMPGEIENPREPSWDEKCPKYGGDAERRDAWIAAAIKKWVHSTTEALFTANLSLSDIEQRIDTRVASRMIRNGSTVVDVNVPDFNLRQKPEAA